MEDGGLDAGFGSAVDGLRERGAVGGGNGQAVHAAGSHGIDNLNLAAVFGLLRGAVPKHVDVEVAAGCDGARLEALPKNMGGGFGHGTAHFFLRLVAPTQQRAAKRDRGAAAASSW